ncbi:SDR family oxidoreductase [Mycolicibacterium smegmatis]|uniref:NAD-dependent epimerase/dehydratase:dTDP-4-dehydrorhamnose reductase:NmrA-like protein n=3 Tax=Mycolicibacterium smegmatis TaxID=1772 RepID=I7GB86_MYCS2|nr:NAD(P)H-binding protein [Mycolicibacterium smegmatis]ABK69742.1 conserved secreted protein [Mycolicibacterium smegmatis MC2 155]AFP40416.1 NAD-dependent epimerase/dehydratase:dTDP-4-dehydrorhamnose reductase:NmrA-like protein [Mycolicibacterium smegmatis MC2 155]AIU09159.1 LysR family transcriptional regulator [Mycolicibacterium smegmatis MC2 155]AIU15784.1 LysR family transcriptional regulator [Mycolicibacterium smegmatis]AIU22407.1 LysR family transcriptional regulator [Mycolicibacterium 
MIASTKKITIVGATGLIGRQLTPLLREAGHDVTEASRASGTDLVTGEGLDVALTDADVVVDVINSATPDDSAEKFFKQTSANLSAAAAQAGVGHYVVLSIVGVDAMAANAGYIRGKLAQESAAAKSGIPWTVVRATQFHELAEPITESLITGEQVRAPKALIQTIDSKEVTAILARIATGSPFNAIHNLGGPQKMTFADMARAVLVHQSRELEVIDDPAATYQGLPVDNTTLVTDDEAELGTTRLSDWLALH